MKKLSLVLFCACLLSGLQAQELTLDQYNLVKGFRIDNLDEDTYVKINQEYVLDRYQMKPPYYIAGDKGSKNRVDLYKFIKREGLQEIGLLMVYTNTLSGKVSHLCLPFQAGKEVWLQYYDDLKYGGQDDPHMAFAIGSVLSRELANLKLTGGSTEDYTVESSDYDICFAGDRLVTTANGEQKRIEEIVVGDLVQALQNGVLVKSKVIDVEQHTGTYKIVRMVASGSANLYASALSMSSTQPFIIEATVNHPVVTPDGEQRIFDLSPGDFVVSVNGEEIRESEVLYLSAQVQSQTVYNLVTEAGTYIVDDIVVTDKR